MCIVGAIWVFMTPSFKISNNEYPFAYFFYLLFINAVQSIFFVPINFTPASFYAKISDEKIGCTYMTFLNAISAFGSAWPNTVAFFIASLLTTKNCTNNQSGSSSSNMLISTFENNFCRNEHESKVNLQ